MFVVTWIGLTGGTGGGGDGLGSGPLCGPPGVAGGVGLGGGGGMDNAYSALASLPGLYVPQGQQGWYQAVYIRGGDYDHE